MIRTKSNALREFNMKTHDWQTKKLIPVEDLSMVVLNLLNEKFAVRIDGNFYDLSFLLNEETGEVGYQYSSAPSPHLLSYEMVERAFREGEWFFVSNDI